MRVSLLDVFIYSNSQTSRTVQSVVRPISLELPQELDSRPLFVPSSSIALVCFGFFASHKPKLSAEG